MWLLRLQKLEGEREDRRVQFGLGFGPLRRWKNCKAKGGCVHKSTSVWKKSWGIEPHREFFFPQRPSRNLSTSPVSFFSYRMVVLGGWTTSLPLCFFLRPDNPFGWDLEWAHAHMRMNIRMNIASASKRKTHSVTHSVVVLWRSMKCSKASQLIGIDMQQMDRTSLLAVVESLSGRL